MLKGPTLERAVGPASHWRHERASTRGQQKRSPQHSGSSNPHTSAGLVGFIASVSCVDPDWGWCL
jgi:hypothetical protein